MIITLFFTQFGFADVTINKTALEFSDLDETYWAYEGIQKLVEAGIIDGYPDGTFKPEGDITRAEFVKIANLVFNYTEKKENTHFSDIKLDDWFYDHVLIAQNAGYILGYPDGTFKPNGLITRQELCVILDSINNFVLLPFDKTINDEVSPWAVDYVSKVVSNRIMELDENNNFRATVKSTRAEACDALARFLLTEEPELENPVGGSTGSTEDDLTDEELYETMGSVTKRLKSGTIPNLTTEAQKEIVNDIIANMSEYQEDNNHDYEEAAKQTYEKYKKLTAEEQEELKYQILKHNITSDLLELKDFFFPNIEIN